MSHFLINDLPKDDRPGEKLCILGENTLSDAELIAIINSTGSKGISAIDLSRKLLAKFDNSLTKLSQASIAELCEINGIGTAKACSLRAVFTLAKRLAGQQSLQKLFSPTTIQLAIPVHLHKIFSQQKISVKLAHC